MPVSHVPGDIFLGIFGGLLPDIDHPRSILGRFNPLARWGLTTHRGFTHTLTALLLFSTPFLVVGILTFSAGYLSHIVADWMYSWGKFKIRFW